MPELRPLVLAELKPPMNITLVQDDAGLDKLAHWIALVDVYKRQVYQRASPAELLLQSCTVASLHWLRLCTLCTCRTFRSL